MFNRTFLHQQVGYGLLVIPGLLILIYGLLSWLAFGDQAFFFESMDMPWPNHEFLIWSWGGKNTAILFGLILAILSRLRQSILIMMAVLFVMQWGDVNAGLRTNVNVFMTWIAMGLTILESLLLLVLPVRKPQ
ncbi:MAG: hypothetical protein AAF206_12000 [Bacteroidota bacterium]